MQCKYPYQKFENCLDIIEKMFYGNYDNIIIVDIDSRERHEAKNLSVPSLKERTSGMLDGIVIVDNKIYIKFNY